MGSGDSAEVEGDAGQGKLCGVRQAQHRSQVPWARVWLCGDHTLAKSLGHSQLSISSLFVGCPSQSELHKYNIWPSCLHNKRVFLIILETRECKTGDPGLQVAIFLLRHLAESREGQEHKNMNSNSKVCTLMTWLMSSECHESYNFKIQTVFSPYQWVTQVSA